MYLIINKGTNEVYQRMELEEVAYIVHQEPQTIEECRDELRASLRDTGRWDRKDNYVIVIPSRPEEDDAWNHPEPPNAFPPED